MRRTRPVGAPIIVCDEKNWDGPSCGATFPSISVSAVRPRSLRIVSPRDTCGTRRRHFHCRELVVSGLTGSDPDEALSLAITRRYPHAAPCWRRAAFHSSQPATGSPKVHFATEDGLPCLDEQIVIANLRCLSFDPHAFKERRSSLPEHQRWYEQAKGLTKRSVTCSSVRCWVPRPNAHACKLLVDRRQSVARVAWCRREVACRRSGCRYRFTLISPLLR
jgi:hypothetical protein